MRELMLGLRLLLGSGRGNRVRFLLMTAGSAIGVCCLAVVLAIPGILAAQDGRMAARNPDCDRVDYEGYCVAAPGDSFELTMTDPYGSQPLTRVFVARGNRSIKPPPGLRQLPKAGEVFVSPRLREELKREPGLAQLVPGEDKGIVGAFGLAHPDELYAYVGVNRGGLEGAHRVTRFGTEDPPDETVEPSTLNILRFTLIGVVLLPLTVFLSVCARLSAAARSRRLAALRLLGLSRKGTQRVNAAETVAAALIGAVMGLCAYWLVNQCVSRTGLPGFKWYPSDGALSASTVIICVAGSTILAWVVGRSSARKAAENPLAVRRSAAEKPPSQWGLLPLIPGLGIVAAYCALGVLGRQPRDTGVSSLLIPLAVILVGAGIVLSLPLLSRSLAGKVARSTKSLAFGLAMRRNEVEPGGVLRVATSLVLLVFSASLVQGVLIELAQVSKNTSPVQLYRISLDGIPAAKQAAWERVKGVHGHMVVMDSWRDLSAERPGGMISAVAATCAQLRSFVPAADSCVDGRAIRLRDPNQGADDIDKPGTNFPFHLWRGKQRHIVHVKLPKRELVYRDYAGLPALSSGDVLLPPSVIPPGFRPENATLVLVSSSAPATVRAVLDGIAGIDPTTEVDTPGIVVTALQQITVIKTLLAVGMILGLIIGVAAYLVAATDRAVERRPQVTALTLLGARPRTLKAVQVAQVVLPLSIGLLLAVITGKMTESSYLVTGGGAVFWDGDGVPLLLVSALGVVVVAALGSLPLVGRRIDPELIRRD